MILKTKRNSSKQGNKEYQERKVQNMSEAETKRTLAETPDVAAGSALTRESPDKQLNYVASAANI